VKAIDYSEVISKPNSPALQIRGSLLPQEVICRCLAENHRIPLLSPSSCPPRFGNSLVMEQSGRDKRHSRSSRRPFTCGLPAVFVQPSCTPWPLNVIVEHTSAPYGRRCVAAAG
jgi:hypothetical protein